jgi:methylenetetrahydrofolate dehydrogenase (NADP+)/methenyltetrahydrofolate cyclohydrolase
MRARPLQRVIQSATAEHKERLRTLGAPEPRLATVIVGEPPAALSYRRSILRTFGHLEIPHVPVDLPEDASDDEVLTRIDELNRDRSITGVMLFMPLSSRRVDQAARETVSPLKDVDGITVVSAGRLRLGLAGLRPSCPLGGVALLRAYNVEVSGADAVVVGRSPVVGGPLATMLLNGDATVTTCHRRTRDLSGQLQRADIVGVAAGRAGLVTADMVKPGAAVLDFGTNVVDGHLQGDVDAEAVREVVGYLSPVPGGTGPVTSLVLAYQTVAAAYALHFGDLEAVSEQMTPVEQLVAGCAVPSAEISQ